MNTKNLEISYKVFGIRFDQDSRFCIKTLQAWNRGYGSPSCLHCWKTGDQTAQMMQLPTSLQVKLPTSWGKELAEILVSSCRIQISKLIWLLATCWYNLKTCQKKKKKESLTKIGKILLITAWSCIKGCSAWELGSDFSPEGGGQGTGSLGQRAWPEFKEHLNSALTQIIGFEFWVVLCGARICSMVPSRMLCDYPSEHTNTNKKLRRCKENAPRNCKGCEKIPRSPRGHVQL